MVMTRPAVEAVGATGSDVLIKVAKTRHDRTGVTGFL